MVYKIVWTKKALETYLANMKYLEEKWTAKVVSNFALAVEKKLILISTQPDTGSPRNKRQQNLRHAVLHKRVSLIYRVKPNKKEIELLRFWNTYQHPSKLKAK